VRRRLAVIASTAVLFASGAGCDSKPSTPAAAPPDTCKASDAPGNDTVRRAINTVPIEVRGSFWVEIGRGHAKKCRLNWVQIIPSIAGESTPQQLLFFDHDTLLGTATPNPKPYITVLPPGDDTVTVQYQWQVGKDEPCCPTGRGTVRFQIGPDGKLRALDKIPHQ
jgi:hypothetical protein